jgi:hypothetical protein
MDCIFWRDLIRKEKKRFFSFFFFKKCCTKEMTPVSASGASGGASGSAQGKTLTDKAAQWTRLQTQRYSSKKAFGSAAPQKEDMPPEHLR